MFTATVRPVANPDFGERRAPAKPATFRATTLGDLSEAFARWRAATGIGGGNMPRTVVDEDGHAIGHLAYNGRVFCVSGRMLYDPR